jgi:hypothetical protein
MAELVRCGRSGALNSSDNAEVAILADFESPGLEPWSASGLYKAMKATFVRCADRLQMRDGVAAERLRRASTHWLRHTHGLWGLKPA